MQTVKGDTAPKYPSDTTFKSGPRPQPGGAVPNVGVGGPGPATVVKTGTGKA